ncbi:hypothetical protein [Actinoplanes sp. NPDC051851]|uniref:hypothetical protein n=1 Tax=Actinoplanes sp. NPDC051851 TaxID=3154753 RepID=UPI0034296A92
MRPVFALNATVRAASIAALGVAVLGGAGGGSVLGGGPARAAVRFDPESLSGFVDAVDVRQALGLDADPAAVAFHLNTDVDDDYAAACGAREITVVHHEQYMTQWLISTVAGAGYAIDGSDQAISGTTAPPRDGDGCAGTHVLAGVHRTRRTTERTLIAAADGREGTVLRTRDVSPRYGAPGR